MPTASEELIALAESPMGAGCWGDGRTGVCAQWSLQSHLHPKSVLRRAHAEICVKGSLCVRACVRGRLLLLMLSVIKGERDISLVSVCTKEQPSSAKRHDAAAATARLHRHLPSAEISLML